MKYSWIILTLLITACGSGGSTNNEEPANEAPTVDNEQSEDINAHISEVTAQGDARNYTFHVTITSDETGCDQYADWWEVLSADGRLIHRRVLGHSHAAEQPFTRSGSPVTIDADEIVYIRAHMNNIGYAGDIFTGSVNNGFLKASNSPTFPTGIEQQQPLPANCAF